jgi:hypothetical protein
MFVDDVRATKGEDGTASAVDDEDEAADKLG